MNKWIAEFELEDGDTMPEHMDLEYKGTKIDFYCRPYESVFDQIREIVERWRNDYRVSTVQALNEIAKVLNLDGEKTNE